MTDFDTLTVAGIDKQTDDSVIVTFDVPSQLESKFSFHPGQHLTIKTTIDEQELRRCYSICSSPDEHKIQIGIKAITDGRFSNYAVHQLKVGDQLEVMSPQGSFGFTPVSGEQKNYLGIAVGSGITPILSMLKSALQQESSSTFTLLYGNRNANSMMFRNQLLELKNRYPDRLHVNCFFSRESNDVELWNGRLDGDKLKQLGGSLFDWSQFDACYVCGPEEILETCYTVLVEGGLSEDNYHVERFNTASKSREKPLNQSESTVVTLKRDGRVMNIDMTSQDDSVLDAALRQGVDLPYACKGGVCATCICKVKSGQVEMATNYSLEAEQVENGYVLSCQAVPTSSEIEIDFDV
ncbi:phenylacetic acid degradation protein [Vibrio sp. MACH09]|uniref:1,2-phenylacetyl-CoA epoxidase subunit PaaE n=1 Tax=unclassified Vibrio TaxID=2614977 RepID=UPI001493D51E|nr:MULTISPECIES: 1,2-phenylacetyl-CoA epoxidase subunit PaaE [unclassified Vibrio]NOI66757.1 phenylacetate-CoA oxygenase/reductase subunit PaaK [Vibrio sp. 99-8-1]GLO61311.1 phenylacetic acid degradation protein [Vibrio sp. MACH09]